MPTKRWVPWFYIGPALLLVTVYYVYPAINTFILSFFNASSTRFVGLKNYIDTFSDPSMWIVFRNNALWIVAFTLFSVVFGLAFAVLFDRIKYEPVAKSLVFMPMAISMVGASVIWRFVYSYAPIGSPQLGLLNSIIVGLGGQPVAWLTIRPWNNFFLIIVGIWIWTGFALVVLSAAYKNISKELRESAQIVGANEWQIFWKINFPILTPTIVVVTTTLIVFVLKIFDIVYVMTNGNFNTEVIANAMFKSLFQFQYFGQASTLATILFLVTIPIMAVNVLRFRRDEEAR